jgi:carbon storage regulator CsrA
MLVLTRDTKENSNTILIGDDIRITILSSSKVKVGIEAPENVDILRGELKFNDSELI